jgi:hypothetical protein
MITAKDIALAMMSFRKVVPDPTNLPGYVTCWWTFMVQNVKTYLHPQTEAARLCG